ncbi:hypothetical protein Rt10032_c17g5902 [Rhodotorula toruloides]|uniref:Uncharacterized protein n=1 Tax=Rhodotorula toruloides TaxID=5286 RepID=A0A511KPL5_RHOTO|nr:hypothetical protein Rt10032_c17g5902 [Rhodotorula toruloides]
MPAHTAFKGSALEHCLERARDAIQRRLPHRNRSKLSRASAAHFEEYRMDLDKAFMLRWHVYGRMYPRLKEGEVGKLLDVIVAWERDYQVDRISHLFEPHFYATYDRIFLANDATIVGLFAALVELVCHLLPTSHLMQRCQAIHSAWAPLGHECDFWLRIPDQARLADEIQALEDLEERVRRRRQSIENARQKQHASSVNEHSLAHTLLDQSLSTRKARIYGMA